MATYNGHKNWNHWNVSLWINNDEGLYALAKRLKRTTPTVERAAERFVGHMISHDVTKTPDGAPYTKTSVCAAMRDL